jgi:hypothetical protein
VEQSKITFSEEMLVPHVVIICSPDSAVNYSGRIRARTDAIPLTDSLMQSGLTCAPIPKRGFPKFRRQRMTRRAGIINHYRMLFVSDYLSSLDVTSRREALIWI